MLPTSEEVIANLKLAEESLENARKLAASVTTPSPMTPEEEQLRRNIGIKAKAFAFEAAPAIDIARADVVTVSTPIRSIGTLFMKGELMLQHSLPTSEHGTFSSTGRRLTTFHLRAAFHTPTSQKQ